jgi:RsiW-degrading membrane proteinase PrsW (M82 family)
VPTVCDRCGSDLFEDSRFCSKCGRLRHFKPRPLLQRSWWRVLIVGFVLSWITRQLLVSTGNFNLIPTVILLGAFLVPVTYVVYLYESGSLYDVPISTVALTFFYGGVLGVIAASVLEQNLVVSMGPLSLVLVAFSEEIAKPLGVLWLIRRQDYADELHGLVLGGAAGMGFAALETMGYGFTYLILSQGNLDVLGQVLLTRGLLAPLAHGTWSAIVVGTIWRERTRGRWLSGRTLRGFGVAVLLHALWDITAPFPIDLPLPGVMLHWQFLDFTIPAIDLPIPGLIIGGIGVWILIRMFRESSQHPSPVIARAA